jgi:hypothetical protein
MHGPELRLLRRRCGRHLLLPVSFLLRARAVVACTAVAATFAWASQSAAQTPPPPPPPTPLLPAATATADPDPDPPPSVAAPPPVSQTLGPYVAPPPPSGTAAADDGPDADDALRTIGEPDSDPSAHKYFPLNASFLYPFATNAGDPNRATNLDVGVLFTKIGYLYGLQTAILASVTQEMIGAQVGLVAITEGPTFGAQVAGAFALSDAPFSGLQVAGLFNWSRFHFEGIEIAGVANQSRKSFSGLQIAGAVNIARRKLHGVQIAGFMNIGEVDGLQLAPLNISSEVTGVQVGIINIARKVSGTQIGLINIADNLQGESIGIASVPRSGGIHGAVWGSNSIYGNFGLKFASRFIYSIVSGGFHVEDKDKVGGKSNLIGPGFTFGFYRPILFQDFYVQADIGGYRLFLTDGAQRAHDEIYKTRLMVRYAIVNRFSMFVGGGAFLGLRGNAPIARFGPEFDAGLEL